MVRERVEERELSEDSNMLRPSSKASAEAHVGATRSIAEQLYAFPTPQYPHYRAFVNQPEVEQKIFTNLGRELAPDIVVLEWPERLPRIVASVATADMLTAENAIVWRLLSRLKDVQFYLYVPAGYATDARKLLKNADVKDVALRTWRRIAGLKTIDVARIR